MNQNFIVSSEYEEDISQEGCPSNKNYEQKGNIPNKKDNNSLDLVIQGEEYSLVNENVVNILYPLLSKTRNCYDKKTNCFFLPKAIKKENFEDFLYYIDVLNSDNSDDPPKSSEINFQNIRGVIDISLFFNAVDIIDFIIKKEIIPRIAQENAIKIIQTFLDLKFLDKVKKIFGEVINQCILCIAQNLTFILKTKKEEFNAFSQEIKEEIIQEYFKSFKSNKTEEIEQVLNILMSSRGIKKDIFELLEYERKKALSTFDNLFNNSSKKISPSKIWKLDLSNEQYQEEKIDFDNIKLKLISYYDTEADTYKLAFQLLESRTSIILENKETKNNEDTFMLNENNEDESSICTAKNFTEEELEKENVNYFISTLSLMEIPEIHFKTKTNFNCIYSNMNSKVLIFQIEKFSKYFENKEFKFTLKIFFSRIYVFPSILDQITSKFSEYKTFTSINKLPKIVLGLILKNKSLIYQNEKDILFAILNWLNNKNSSQVMSSMDLFKNIKWQSLDNETLIDFFMYNYNLLSLSKDLVNAIFSEFQRRFQADYSHSASIINTSIQPSLLTSNSISEAGFNSNNNNHTPPEFTNEFLTRVLTNCSKSQISLRNENDTEIGVEKEKTKNIIFTSPNETNMYRNKNQLQNKSNSMILQSHNQIKSTFFETSNPLSPNNYLVKKDTKQQNTLDRGINKTSGNNYQTNISNKSSNNSALSSQANITNSNNILHKKYIDKNILNKLLNNNRSNTPDFIAKTKQVANKKSSRLPSQSRGHSKSIESKNKTTPTREFNANSLNNTHKINSLYPKYISSANQSNYNPNLIMSKTNKFIKNNSKDCYIPINKNQNSIYYTNISARNELIKTESSTSQNKKSKEKYKKPLSVHGRSKSNH